MIPPERLRELAAGATLYGHERNAMAAEMLAARETERELVDVLRRNGFRKCDVPACNCDSWHQVDGYAARFREIDDAVGDHNGKTLLQAVKEVVADRDESRDLIASAMHDVGERSFLEDAQRILQGCVAPYSCEQMKAVSDALRQWRDKWAILLEMLVRSNEERDAARAEAKKYHDALVARHGGEPVALLSELDAARAECAMVAKQRDELVKALRHVMDAEGEWKPSSVSVAMDALAMAAEQPKPACHLCNLPMPDGTDGHGLGECMPVCPTCDGSGTAEQPKPAGGA